MKIVVFGLNRNVIDLVDMLIDNNFEVQCIIPPTEKKSSQYTQDKLFGIQKIKIPIFNTDNINGTDFIQKIKSLECDLIVNWEHTQIFSPELLSCPKIGSLNFHRGLLPNARGFDPIRGERLNEIEELGQTVHFMTTKIDQGKIVSQRSFKINKNLDRVEIDKIFQDGAVKFYFDAITKAISGNSISYKDTFGRYYPKFPFEKEILDWEKNSNTILTQIRSSTPFNPCVSFLSGSYEEIKILKSSESDVENYSSICGQVIDRDNSLGNLIKTGDNAIWLTEIKFKEQIQIPSFPIGTIFVSNWIQETMSLHKRIKDIERRLDDSNN